MQTYLVCISYGDHCNLSMFQAKGLLSEYQPKFNSAKAVYRERKKYIDDIDWSMLATPSTGSSKVSSWSGHNVDLH